MKVILISHGRFCEEILKSAEMILGPQENVYPIIFLASDSLQTLKDRTEEKLKELSGEEIVIITDLKGGTPCNVAFLLQKAYNFTLLTGLNLPILLEALISKDIESDSEALGDKLVEVGSHSIEKIILRREGK